MKNRGEGKFSKFIYSINLTVIISLFIVPTLLILYEQSAVFAQEEISGVNNKELKPNKDKVSIEMLLSIIELRKNLEKRVAENKTLLENSTSDSEKEALQQELDKLDKQIKDADSDFERIATGIDIDNFTEKKVEEFNWKNEILSLAEPAIKELKLVTLKARQKTKLKEEIGYYGNLLPVTDKALENLNVLISNISDKQIKLYLENLINEWTGVKEQLENKLKITEMQLNKMENEEASFVESSQSIIKNFFKTRGLYLFIALIASIGVIFILRLIYLGLIKVLPDYQSEYRPFYIRVIDLLFKILSLLLTLSALIFVFYYAEDWFLLSLTIIFLMGLAWAVKYSIPILWQQSRLMLNIGSVREGERIIYNGLPWLVKSINVFCKLENPALDKTIRLPIEELSGKISIPFKQGDPWFPCKKNDWVSLSDGIMGKVTSLSCDIVELTLHGGAKKTYQTSDFIGLSPLNISTNFRLSILFGIGYAHQKEATSTVADTLYNYIMDKIQEEKLAENLLNLKVEFAQAGASSLDLIVLADFSGKVADKYSSLNRAIQKWCVDASTANNWDIPFPQLTIHRA